MASGASRGLSAIRPLAAVPFMLAVQCGALAVGHARDFVSVQREHFDVEKKVAEMRDIAALAREARKRADDAGKPALQEQQLETAALEHAEVLSGYEGHLDDVSGGIVPRFTALAYLSLNWGIDTVRAAQNKPQPWVRLSNGHNSTFIDSAEFRGLPEATRDLLRRESYASLITRVVRVGALGFLLGLSGIAWFRFRGCDTSAFGDRQEMPLVPAELTALQGTLKRRGDGDGKSSVARF